MAVILSKLAVHYHRPDFSEAQAKSLISDFIEDLDGFDPTDVQAAARDYRTRPDSEFFPKIGRLIELAKEAKASREYQAAKAREWKDARVSGFGPRSALTLRPLPEETRPMFWWLKDKRTWHPHWREEDIPPEHRIAYWNIVNCDPKVLEARRAKLRDLAAFAKPADVFTVADQAPPSDAVRNSPLARRMAPA